uniref:CEP170 C-terminal domain-containing protein n=1 Tax=Cyprinus carpio TaxID=7962 RepID=A0A8C2KNH4_CYPCA
MDICLKFVFTVWYWCLLTDITKEAQTAEGEFNITVQELRGGQAKSTYPYHREPSYFEIPTKDMQPKSPTTDLIDIPTKDTNIPLISTPPVVQSHASFTIEFDDCMPGKIKIKDHVTKFSSRQRSKQQQQPSNSQVATPTEVLSASSKVADWLVQSDVGIMCRRPPCEDVYSTKSDLAMHIRTLKGHHHEDGTQSDSEDPVMKGQHSKSHHSMQSQSSVQSHQSPIHPEPHAQQAFIIEFFEDNPRKKRSQSFTHNSVHADSYSALKAKLERRKGLAHGERPASVHGPGGSQRSSSLKREKTEDGVTSTSLLGTSSRSSPAITIKPFGSVGKKSKLSQDFTAEFLKEMAEPSGPSSVSYPSSPSQLPALSQSILSDSLSDAGTYTIETESQDKEVEEARSMIDQVINPSFFFLGKDTYCITIGAHPDVGGPKWVSRWASLADTYSDPVATQGSMGIPPQSGPGSQVSRSRRLLPQVPPGEKLENTTPSILIRHEINMDHEPPEKGSSVPRQQDCTQRLCVQDDVDPDSLSDTSRSDDILSQPERDSSPKIPPTTVLIRHLSETAMSFVRQESFTKDRPSDNIQVKKLPHISSHPALRSLDTEEAVRDTFPYPKEAEKSLTSPVEKLPGSSQQSKTGSCPAHEDSLSGDSDVDTASTVSMVSNKNAPISANKKHTSAADLRKEKSSSGLQARQPTARERLSEKRRNHASADNNNKAELSRRLQLRRSAGNRGSLDLSENHHGQQLWPEAAASDHESITRPNNRKKLTASLQKEDPSKMTKGSHQVLTRSNSLSAPRPTRASMLRRARLGEASDNESAETDRASQSSDHSKTPTEGKKLSRLDILAMPRKRTGSFTVPSDSESTSSKHGISNCPTEANSSVRKASSEVRQATNKGVASVGKHSATRSHHRQKDSDYSSTSEEEFENNSNSKHKRSHASASTQTLTPQKTIQMRLKCSSLEAEEDETQNEHFQNWSTHSAEIARLSQDLAKDLAILAREIHDVAGDGDSQTSSGMGAATSPGSMPNTPASTISTREELVQHIPEASLNYQKVPPGSTSPIDQDSNMNDHDSSRRRPWNREEVILDNLMLNPVSQLSQAIRENTEQLAEKMKALFHNKTEVWEEIEAKINAENEVPILKTSNKEISSILQELRRVQRQLEGEFFSIRFLTLTLYTTHSGPSLHPLVFYLCHTSVINTIVEPGGILNIHSKGTSPGRKTKSASKELTSLTSTNANASAKRGPRGPEGGRYVV